MPPTPPSPIFQAGPWGLLRTRHSLWVVSPDGSGLARLIEEDGAIFQVAASPSGGIVAFVAADKRETFWDLRLKYLTLPSGEVRQVTHLLPPGTETARAHTGDPLYEATRSIRRTGLAWSPDGQQLAFVGAQSGVNADLYVYSLDTGMITRLSDEAAQAYDPSWSPDGCHILFPSVRHFGTGAGYTVGGTWMAGTDGSGVHRLYQPKSMGEELVGWIDEETVWLFSWSDVFGNINLRMLNITTGHLEILWSDSFTTLAWDPQSGVVLVGLSEFAAYSDAERHKGIYLILPRQEEPKHLAEIDVSGIVWSEEANLFLVRSQEGILAVRPTGEITFTGLEAPAPDLPVVAPEGRTWAWGSSRDTSALGAGLWVGRLGEPPRRVWDARAVVVGWSPDGRALFFAGDGLYVAHAPDFAPIPISPTLQPSDNLIWVLP
jgi:WD40 repeat protein